MQIEEIHVLKRNLANKWVFLKQHKRLVGCKTMSLCWGCSMVMLWCTCKYSLWKLHIRKTKWISSIRHLCVALSDLIPSPNWRNMKEWDSFKRNMGSCLCKLTNAPCIFQPGMKRFPQIKHSKWKENEDTILQVSCNGIRRLPKCIDEIEKD